LSKAATTQLYRKDTALILTAPGLAVIVDGIAEARWIFQRMTSYVLYPIAMTIDVMAFVVLA
jgi:H+-transporting ATPase